MINLVEGLLFSSIFLSILLLVEHLTRKFGLSSEWTRRIAHVLSGVFAIFMGYVVASWIFLLLSITFFIIISWSYWVGYFTSIHEVKRKTYGELLFPVGVAIAYIVAGGPTKAYLISVLILTLSDTTVGVFGSMLNLEKKSLRRFAVFFLLTLIILLIASQNQLSYSMILVSLVIAVVELISPFGSDNLFIPLSSSLLVRFLL